MAFFDRIAGLERGHASFAIATVVARSSPVSSHLGDRALVFADGRMEGFVGGSCSRDVVRRHALAAIQNRAPVLLQIRPTLRTGPAVADAVDGAKTERVVVPMSCASEGAVDVYIEPRVPSRCLVVVGLTPVADALARLGAALDYAVVRVVVETELRDIAPAERADRIVELRELRQFLATLDDRARRDVVAVVASQGHYDELALEALLAWPLAFIGLLASRRRAATVFGVLEQQGLSPERLAVVRNPVGLDLGARGPGEVAVSILAQIIAQEPRAVEAEDATEPRAAAPGGGSGGHVTDPICGMAVDPGAALYRFEHAATGYFFCGAHCRAAFAADPERYVLQPGNV